ncbi:MAG: type II toxin-antitoxin system RelE/ParE family toxin [Thiotrichaceae bacterium]|nr:type II toxin-antitoxin system RelE/ParE family toxin [Thiotrichaceae bacterium]
MAIYKVSPAAEQDLIDIYSRGLNKWGEKQADEYQIRLISAFHTMVNNPDLGRKVTIRPQLQQYSVVPYVVFYRKFSYGIRIARILYKNRAMEKHLTGTEPY